MKIRTLIIDDSALARNLLSKGLSDDPMIEVIGTASVEVKEAADNDRIGRGRVLIAPGGMHCRVVRWVANTGSGAQTVRR